MTAETLASLSPHGSRGGAGTEASGREISGGGVERSRPSQENLSADTEASGSAPADPDRRCRCGGCCVVHRHCGGEDGPRSAASGTRQGCTDRTIRLSGLDSICVRAARSVPDVPGEPIPYGTARYHGALTEKDLRSPVVGIASSAGGSGYWLATANGGVFSLGQCQVPRRCAGTGKRPHRRYRRHRRSRRLLAGE